MPDNIDPAAAQTPQVIQMNSEDFAAAMSRHFAPIMQALQTPQPSGVPAKSEFQAALDNILSREGVEQTQIAQFVELLQAAGNELTAKQKQDFAEKLKDERDARAVMDFRRAIQPYASQDEDIRDTEKLILERALDDFNKLPEYERARQEYAKGVLDLGAVDAIVKKHVERRAKISGRDKAAGSAAGAGKTSLSSTPANNTSAAAAEAAAGASPSSLRADQQDLYSAHKDMLLRNGIKAEDAHKEAMAAALRRKSAPKSLSA